jgi:hypothetical protein
MYIAVFWVMIPFNLVGAALSFRVKVKVGHGAGVCTTGLKRIYEDTCTGLMEVSSIEFNKLQFY